MSSGRYDKLIYLQTRNIGVGLRFCSGYLFLLHFLFRQLPSELTERNSTKLCHMFRSKPYMKLHVQNLGCSLPLFWSFSMTL